MPTLDFKGKHHIYAHHLSVPYRPLEPDKSRSCNPSGAEGNLIIHGDNLKALKALLPRYANRVKCIYIDPPYNTGNEGWIYSDNVNNPPMQEWFKEHSPIDNEDMEKHDKWLCMMWPRMHLLKELLAEDGIIFISIDDNEVHHLRMLMNEIFGARNFIACLPTVTNLKGNNDEFGFAGTHEYTFSWAKNRDIVKIGEFALEDEDLESWLEDDYGYYKKGANLKSTGGNAPRHKRPNLFYPIFVSKKDELTVSENLKSEEYEKILPLTNGEEMSWRWSKEKVKAESHNIIIERTKSSINLFKKQRPTVGDLPTKKPKSLFYKPEYSSGNGTAVMKEIFASKVFNNPKPIQLLKDIISLSTKQDDIILDSFAGSGTTAHAVLALNKEDGGNRKFILVECEDYADTITAERVRRIINGIENAKDKTLKEGLGGSFTYCTLGKPIEIEAMLTGESLPSYSVLASQLLFAATGVSVGDEKLEQKNADGLFYSNDKNDYYLHYQPDLDYLGSDEAILTQEHAERIRDTSHQNGKKAIVYAAGNYIGQRELTKMGIVFCQLPYVLHER